MIISIFLICLFLTSGSFLVADWLARRKAHKAKLQEVAPTDLEMASAS